MKKIFANFYSVKFVSLFLCISISSCSQKKPQLDWVVLYNNNSSEKIHSDRILLYKIATDNPADVLRGSNYEDYLKLYFTVCGFQLETRSLSTAAPFFDASGTPSAEEIRALTPDHPDDVVVAVAWASGDRKRGAYVASIIDGDGMKVNSSIRFNIDNFGYKNIPDEFASALYDRLKFLKLIPDCQHKKG